MITEEKTLNQYPDTKIPDHPKGEKSIKNKNWKKEEREKHLKGVLHMVLVMKIQKVKNVLVYG